MNANELADELEGAVLKLLANDCFAEAQAVEKVETMLRQQKAEIEVLHKEREGLCVFCENRVILRKAQENG